MSIVAAVAVPHPPLIFEKVGQGREKMINETIQSYRLAMRFLASFRPDTVILATPHAEMYSDYFHVSGSDKAVGDFSKFGFPEIKVYADYDREFVQNLEKECLKKSIPCGTLGQRDPSLDHASIIPLSFFNEFWQNYKVVRTGLSGLDFLTHYKLGTILADVSNKLNKRAVFIASGDLSHKLSKDGPYGFAEEGPQFDKKITEILDKADFEKLLDFSPQFCKNAAECGHRAFVMMAGAFDGKALKSKLLSYEGPFGVGYAVAQFEPLKDDESRFFAKEYEKKREKEKQERLKKEDEFVSFARKCVEAFVLTKTPLKTDFDLPQSLTKNKAGVFVTLKKNGNLRGCIGTIEPTQQDIAHEIYYNAISACSKDPRFIPVSPEELEDIVYSIDVLNEPKPVSDIRALDPKKDGIIVQSGLKRGLLLPDIQGVDTVEKQIEIASMKAGIKPNERMQLFYFQVERHH